MRTASVVLRSRRSFPPRGSLLIVLACLAALLSATFLGCASAQQEVKAEAQSSATDRPNIVFVLTDDLDYASAFKMPEIRSQLIEEGLSLEEAFVSHPTVAPLGLPSSRHSSGSRCVDGRHSTSSKGGDGAPSVPAHLFEPGACRHRNWS